MRFQNTKIDFIIKYNPNNKLTSKWNKAEEFTITDYMNYDVIVPRNNLNELKAVTSNITNINNLSATLYFHKSAVFPRYKLQDSRFKRCIKIEKADYIVISNEYKTLLPKQISNSVKNYAIIKSGTYVYAVTESALSRPQSLEFLHNALKANLNYFNDYYDIKSEDLGEMEILYQGEVLELTNEEELLYLYTIGAITKPFITDAALEKTISNKLSKLTWDDICSIKEMLSTRDSQVNILGLKLLGGFDVYEYPRTISTLLAITNYYWYNSNPPIIVESLLKSLSYVQNTYKFPACLRSICRIKPNNEQDEKWAKDLIYDATINLVNIEIEGIRQRIDDTGFKLMADVRIE